MTQDAKRVRTRSTKCSDLKTHFGEYGECACVCGRCYDRATKTCKCDQCCVRPEEKAMTEGRGTSPVAWTLDDLHLLEWAEVMEPRVAAALTINPEDHATKSRDYGRGFAEAIRQVRAVLDV